MGNCLIVRKGVESKITSLYKDIYSEGDYWTDSLDVESSSNTCYVIISGTSRVSSDYYTYAEVHGSNDNSNFTLLDSRKSVKANPMVWRGTFKGYRYYRIYLSQRGDKSNLPFMTAYVFALI